MVKNWLSQAWIKAFLSENLPGACAGREPQDPDRLRPRRARCGAASVQPGPALISPSPSPHRRKGAPDGFRLNFTEQGSTQTTAGSASQTQREHPDRYRLSLIDIEGAPRPLQAQPHRRRGSTQTASGSASAFIAPSAPSRRQGLRPGFSPRPSFGIFGASPLFRRGILL